MNLDLSERDQETLLNLSIQSKNTSRVAKIAACCGEGVHGCQQNSKTETTQKRESDGKTFQDTEGELQAKGNKNWVVAKITQWDL